MPWEKYDREEFILLRELTEELKTATGQRDELARQLEDARRLACHYAELLHQAHGERPFMIERDARTR